MILWDATTGKPRGEPLAGHKGVPGVVYSPDGKTLASASFDSTVILWDATTGKPRGEPLTGHKGAVNGVAYSPDGKTLASASCDKTVILWDVDPRSWETKAIAGPAATCRWPSGRSTSGPICPTGSPRPSFPPARGSPRPTWPPVREPAGSPASTDASK